MQSPRIPHLEAVHRILWADRTNLRLVVDHMRLPLPFIVMVNWLWLDYWCIRLSISIYSYWLNNCYCWSSSRGLLLTLLTLPLPKGLTHSTSKLATLTEPSYQGPITQNSNVPTLMTIGAGAGGALGACCTGIVGTEKPSLNHLDYIWQSEDWFRKGCPLYLVQS